MALSVMRGLTERIRYTTEFLNEVQTWVKKIADGNYDRAHQADATYEDPSIQNLAADFAQMAARVQEREQALRKEVSRLKIQIDQAKKERQVQEIVGSDYFQSLKEQADKLRGK
jgi:signal transduction histidine kinase